MLTETRQPVPAPIPREYPTEWTIYATDDELKKPPKRESAPSGAREKDHAA